MATFSHPRAKASWQGNYDVFGAGYNGIRLEAIELNVDAAQLVSGNVFNLIKLSSNTVILGGWIETDTLDSGTPTLDLDVGYDLDSGTDDPNYFFEGGGAGASFSGNFIAGVGAAAIPFVATDDYFVNVTLTASAATGEDGAIRVYLILADADSVAGDAS